jgi:rhodanese-related sulfurtransferase
LRALNLKISCVFNSEKWFLNIYFFIKNSSFGKFKIAYILYLFYDSSNKVFCIKNTMDYMTQEDLKKLRNKVLIIDVRDPVEFEKTHIKGSLNIPESVIIFNLDKLPKNKKIITVCQYGEQRSVKIQKLLKEKGFDAKYLKGGINEFSNLL